MHTCSKLGPQQSLQYRETRRCDLKSPQHINTPHQLHQLKLRPHQQLQYCRKQRSSPTPTKHLQTTPPKTSLFYHTHLFRIRMLFLTLFHSQLKQNLHVHLFLNWKWWKQTCRTTCVDQQRPYFIHSWSFRLRILDFTGTYIFFHRQTSWPIFYGSRNSYRNFASVSDPTLRCRMYSLV